MSARVPFMPQRPASRQQQESVAPSLSNAPHDAFRPNGLLPGTALEPPDAPYASSATMDAHIPTRQSAEAALKAASNKPLNLSGLARRKPAPPANVVIGGQTRKSFDGSDPRPAKGFLAPSQVHRLSAARPSSPFFSGSAGSDGSNFVSTNGFRPPMLPVPSKMQTASSGDDLSANAHISSSATRDGDTDGEHSGNCDRYEGLYSLGFNATERGHARPRTASQPSLEKINEAEDEEENTESAPEQNSHGFPDDGDAPSDEAQSQHGLRRSTKRIHQHEFEEDEFAYGAQAKRYKTDGPSNGFAAPYSRGPTPDTRGYTAREDYDGRAPPESGVHEWPYSRMSEAHGHGQAGMPSSPIGHGEALYKLLGHELTAFVEGHVDAYEEAKKKWSECSIDEWRAGADELTTKFSKMLDFVKDHMTTKLSVYASLHSAVASHKTALTEREKTLAEARESLVREGGAVVGGGGNAVPSGASAQDG